MLREWKEHQQSRENITGYHPRSIVSSIWYFILIQQLYGIQITRTSDSSEPADFSNVTHKWIFQEEYSSSIIESFACQRGREVAARETRTREAPPRACAEDVTGGRRGLRIKTSLSHLGHIQGRRHLLRFGLHRAVAEGPFQHRLLDPQQLTHLF